MVSNLLTYLIFIPLLGAFLLLTIPNLFRKSFRFVALFVSLVQVGLGTLILMEFDGSIDPSTWSEAFQFEENHQWILMNLGSFGWLSANYHLGVDGISLWLVFLSVILFLIGVISSWNVKDKSKGYFFLLLVLNSSVIGCFLALDLLLFYLFFEFMLLPMFFLIGIWGGERRSYASIKFFIYTFFGSLLILIVFIGLYLSTSDPLHSEQLADVVHTFDMVVILDGNYLETGWLSPLQKSELFGVPIRHIAFLLLFVGFAIKLPIVPVHTWLPDAHVEAPTAISVLLAGLLLKVGGYGFIRIAYSIFPEGAITYAYEIGILGLVSIIYGGLSAMAQGDMKRLIAYSSISHMGFVMLGLAALTIESTNGALYQMISHGFISGALFLIVGIYYDRSHDRKIENASGLASRLPYYTFFAVIFSFASLGLPGFSGFVGELFILLGAIGSEEMNGLLPRWIGILAVSGIVISAAYYLWMIQRMFMGRFWLRKQEWESGMTDLTIREWIMLTPLAIAVIILGIYPSLLIDPISNTLDFFNRFVFERAARYGAL